MTSNSTTTASRQGLPICSDNSEIIYGTFSPLSDGWSYSFAQPENHRPQLFDNAHWLSSTYDFHLGRWFSGLWWWMGLHIVKCSVAPSVRVTVKMVYPVLIKVRAYTRVRFGKVEKVRSHYRRYWGIWCRGKEELGIGYKSLANYFVNHDEFSNEHCIVRKGELVTSKRAK